MNWWLVIVAAVMTVFVLAMIFYLVFLYQSEEDANQAWLPKVIVISGLALACFNVLLLPYDVANRQSTSVANSVGGGINTVLVWQIVTYSIAAYTFLIVPFCIFYYEAMDPEKQDNCMHQVRPAACFTFITLAVFMIILIVLWLTVGQAEIKFNLYVANGAAVVPSSATVPLTAASTENSLDVKVSLFVYLVGLMSAIGWILFFVFGGIGLAALPMDLIKDFRDRPQPMNVQEFAARKEVIGREAAKLAEEGKVLDETTKGGGRRSRQKVNLFRRKVQALEDAYDKLLISYDKQGGNILPQYLGLFAGIVGTLLSICWVLHIIINNLIHAWPFLNAFFVAMDQAFSLLGTFFYGLFAFYLLWCVVKGCTKFGLNCLIMTVYPMKLGGTMMNAFLFNTLLILIASVSVVQFCAISFREYASNTAVDNLFSVYVSRLKGINYIVEYLQYPMAGVALLSFLWLALRPDCCVPKDDEDDD